jgi:hypothetical protein
MMEEILVIHGNVFKKQHIVLNTGLQLSQEIMAVPLVKQYGLMMMDSVVELPLMRKYIPW